MNPKIYFICPTNKFASGGVKQIYRQVELLNANGFNAVLLLKKNTAQKWFSSKVPIEVSPYIFKKLKYQYKKKKINFFRKLTLSFLKTLSIALEKDSVLVFPEIYGPKICEIETGTKKVIFNQNCYYTFEHFSLFQEVKDNPYLHKDTLATIVCSEDAQQYIENTFPTASTYRMRLGIDSEIFSFSENKKNQIAFMPRKLADDVLQVINILRLRDGLKNWDFIPIENKTEKEVAEIMKESAVFLSFNHKEGFGLPPAEAMACGCYVVGYCGQGGEEYFRPEFSTSVPDGDIISFVKSVETACQEIDENPVFRDKGRLASDFIKENYSIKNEETDVVRIWKTILS